MLLAPFALADVAAQLRVDGGPFRFAVAPIGCSPLEFVRAAAPVFGSARYVATPEGIRIGSVGVAWRAESGGPQRFQRLGDAWQARPEMPAEARCFLGFSFAPEGARSDEWEGFSAAEIVLPSVAVVADAAGSRLVVAIPPGADPAALVGVLRTLSTPPTPRLPGLGDHFVHSHPAGSDWCSAVEAAVEAIRGGSLHKVVLARSVHVRTEMPIDPYEVVHHLALRNPQCYVYGWQLGDAVFLGASPELLVGIHGENVHSNPLAGSAQRGDGDDEDRLVGAELIASAKDRSEHALVVDDIASRLTPLTTSLAVPAAPTLRRIATVQHLSTEISGRIVDGTSLLDFVGTLHPTPAVGGAPRPDAMAFIEKIEGMDRGWYSGGVGWIDPGGDGDVAVSLRCALIDGNLARLYAGNGIVADSQPEAELIETRWKFRPLLNVLTAT